MNEHDDQDWAKLLAGLQPADADSHTVREARALRQSVLNLEQGQPTSDPATLDRLMFRLKQEGLLKEPFRTAARPWSWQLALAASVMAVGVGVVILSGIWQQPSLAPKDVLQTDARTVQVQLSDNPRAARDTLLRELKDAGMAVTTVDGDGLHSLQFHIDAADAMRIRPLLGRHGMTVPVGGEIVIEFRQRR